MKTNNENVLKYLADVMDENDRIKFEEELANSSELQSRLANVREQFYSMRLDADILDERYFSNLLPRVHQRMEEKKSKSQFAEKVYYFVPYLAAAVVALLFLFKPTYNFDNEYKDLAGKVVNNMTDQDVATKYFDESDTEPVYLETTSNDNSLSSLIPTSLDVNSEDASKILNGTVLDEYGTLYGYSDDQLKTIADNLDKLNIK